MVAEIDDGLEFCAVVRTKSSLVTGGSVEDVPVGIMVARVRDAGIPLIIFQRGEEEISIKLTREQALFLASALSLVVTDEELE